MQDNARPHSAAITRQFLATNNVSVLCGSVVKCLIYNQGVLILSSTVSSGIFVGVPLGNKLQNPSLVLVKHRKDVNNVRCHHDID